MKRIIIRIGGGLGNQLFQCAHAKFLADKVGGKILYDTNELLIGKFYCWKYRRRFGLKDFLGPSQEKRLNWAQKPFYLMLWIALKLLKKENLQRKLLKFCRIDWSDITPSLSARTWISNHRKPNATVLCSGMQNDLSVTPPRDELRKYLTFKSNPKSEAIPFIKEIGDGSNWCAIHIRRSDYLAFNGELGLGYYRKAMNVVKQRIGNPRWLIFSDDIGWCKDQFAATPNVSFFNGDLLNPTDDLRLMTLCKHHIIANSTLSWWGAYLGSEDGITTYPGNWYSRDSDRNAFIPSSWVAIE